MYTQQVLLEALRRLPENFRTYILSLEVTQSVKNISEKYNLDIRTREALTYEITITLLQLRTIEEFKKELPLHLNVPTQTANLIADEAIRTILEPGQIILKQSISEEGLRVAEQSQEVNTEENSSKPEVNTVKITSEQQGAGSFTQTPRTTSRPLQRKTLSDKDLEEARKALRDPYREKPE